MKIKACDVETNKIKKFEAELVQTDDLPVILVDVGNELKARIYLKSAGDYFFVYGKKYTVSPYEIERFLAE